MTHFTRPTVSLEFAEIPATETLPAQSYYRAIFNILSGPRIFGPWMRSVNAAISALARTMSEHPQCALALMPLVVIGEWKTDPGPEPPHVHTWCKDGPPKCACGAFKDPRDASIGLAGCGPNGSRVF